MTKEAQPSDHKIEQIEEGSSPTATNWTGSKDQSLKSMADFLESPAASKKQGLTDDFLQNATVLLKSTLEDNNLNLYMQAVDVAFAFFKKALHTEAVQGALPALIRPVVLRTTDTNTRVRKRSVELLLQVWTQPCQI